jgi:phospholipid/cholesterol/gamma-HCH transport system permease protein
MQAKIVKKRSAVISPGIDGFFKEIYQVFKFAGLFFKEAFTPPFKGREIVRQFYEIGVRSLPLISVTGFVTGIVFTKQSRPSLAEFGATSWLPSLIAIAILRALAPLITALITSGKVGSNIGAELGSMKVTEQIDAMEVSASNPFKFLVVTRVWATTLMIPVLMLYTGFIALMGGYINIHMNEMTSFASFFEKAFERITFLDFFASIIKSLFFGFTIGIVSCYKGYTTSQGTRGVGIAANASVVISMFLIFVEEIIAVQITGWFR